MAFENVVDAMFPICVAETSVLLRIAIRFAVAIPYTMSTSPSLSRSPCDMPLIPVVAWALTREVGQSVMFRSPVLLMAYR